MAKERDSALASKSPARQPHRPPDDPKAVQAAVRKIREHYEFGQASLQVNPERAAYRSSAPLLWKARRFAARFSPEEVEDLVTLCETHRTALGLSLLARLVTVTDKRKRRSLQVQLVRERWSKIVLDREIRARFGRRGPLERNLGRNSHKPRDVNDALSEIIRLSLRLTRWGDVVGWDPKSQEIDRDDGGEIVANLPETILKMLLTALLAVQKLQNAAERELKRRA